MLTAASSHRLRPRLAGCSAATSWTTCGWNLNQGYLPGLRLAQIEPGHPLVGSPLLARAKDSADCLARLADELEPEPAETCVDEARIAACLGEPLHR